MAQKIYVNGKLVPREEARISVFDHGLLYGDGVFEGIRAYDGRVFRLSQHLDRLYDSARAIALKIPMSKKEMEQAVIQTLKSNSLKSGYVRLVVTRGEGDLGLDPNNCGKPVVFIIADKIELYPEELYKKGLELATVPTKRNIPEAIDPRIKSLNYLNNILAKIEAGLQNMSEAVMLNKDGYVAECTGDNIFIVEENVLITPPLYVGVLAGITRQAVMELAREKLDLVVKEEVFTRFRLYNADECFLTGTAAEVIPVVKIDGRKIAEGKLGKVTAGLIKEFRDLTKREGAKI